MKKVRAEGSETGVRSPAKQDEGKAQKRTSRQHRLEECRLATPQRQCKGIRLSLCLLMCQPNRAWHVLPMLSGSRSKDPASADGDQHGTGGQGGKHQHGEKEKRKKPNEKRQGRVFCSASIKKRLQHPLQSARLRCAAQPPGAMHGTGPPRRGHSLRSSRTGWQHPVQTGFRQSPCRPGRGAQFHGQRLGGRHKQSWRWSV